MNEKLGLAPIVVFVFYIDLMLSEAYQQPTSLKDSLKNKIKKITTTKILASTFINMHFHSKKHITSFLSSKHRSSQTDPPTTLSHARQFRKDNGEPGNKARDIS